MGIGIDNGSSSHTQRTTSLWFVGRRGLYRDRSLAARISRGAVAPVGTWNRRPAHRVWRPASDRAGSRAQGMDVGGAYSGVDQYQDSARHRVLCPGDSNWPCVPAHGEGYDETGILRAKCDLSGGSPNAATIAYEVSILKQSSHRRFPVGEFVMELWAFMKERKKFWLLPIIIVLLLLGTLIVLTQGSAVAPFIYTLF